MNQNTNKSTDAWTKAHDELCTEHRFKGAVEKLWRWLLRYGTPGKQIEPDLLEFNAWVEESGGKPYCAKHLKNSFQKLVDKGLIFLKKKYKWSQFKLIVKPLDWFESRRKKEEKKSDFRNNSSNSSPESPEKSLQNPDVVNQQQHSSINKSEQVSEETKEEIKLLCKQEADIQLPEKCDIYYYPIDKIKISLSFLKLRNKRETIPNRIGWVIDCLRNEYWQEDENKRVLQLKNIIPQNSPYYDYYL
jgi:hypothetical protein